jgi:hypothetical protein
MLAFSYSFAQRLRGTTSDCGQESEEAEYAHSKHALDSVGKVAQIARQTRIDKQVVERQASP